MDKHARSLGSDAEEFLHQIRRYYQAGKASQHNDKIEGLIHTVKAN